MPPIVPVGLEEEPPTDSDNEFYSEDELPNFALQEDFLDSDSSHSPVPDDDVIDEERQSNNSPSITNYGYELLPQEPEAILRGSNLSTDSNSSPIITPVLLGEVIEEESPSMSTTELPVIRPLPLDKDQIEKIKAVMVNVTLPSTSIPNWATDIPEDSWKDHLLSRIQSKQDS